MGSTLRWAAVAIFAVGLAYIGYVQFKQTQNLNGVIAYLQQEAQKKNGIDVKDAGGNKYMNVREKEGKLDIEIFGDHTKAVQTFVKEVAEGFKDYKCVKAEAKK